MLQGYGSFQPISIRLPSVSSPITSHRLPLCPSPALPYATAMPDDVAVRVGEVIRLQCVAHGTPPLQYTWSKEEGSLPARAMVSEGDLQIDLATPDDAGNYKCAVTNRMGRSETLAKVTVRCESTRGRWMGGLIKGYN